MSLGIAARVVAAAIVLVRERADDLGTRRHRSRVVRVGVGDDDVGALRADAADLSPGQPADVEPLKAGS